MEFIEKFKVYLSSLDHKKFTQYLSVLIGTIALLMGLLLFYNYWKLSKLREKFEVIQEEREQTKRLLEKAQHIALQKKSIDDLIAQDRSFKIAGYFEELIKKMGLDQKKKQPLETEINPVENKYLESTLTAFFAGMTMKEVTQLLQEIELNKRVYIRELILAASSQNTMDVTLVAGTLELKPHESSE